MNRLIVAGLIAGIVLVAGCDGSGIRSGSRAPQVAAADLQAASTDTAVKAFYETRNWTGAWSGKSEQALKAAIDARAEHGLDRLTFWQEPGGKSPAEREALLTQAALRYAGALARGASDPDSLHEIYELKRPDTDVAVGLQSALDGGDLAGWLAGLAPQDEGYGALSKAYAGQRGGQPAGGGIAPGEPIKPGGSDPRIPQVRATLADAGYLDTPGGEGEVYDPALANAVRTLQVNYGITGDGVVGEDTLAVLNMGPEGRARALAVAMERLRWLERNPAPDRIDVNIAAAELIYFRGGQMADRRKAVTGEPGTETLQMESPIYRLVANPTWTVPTSIEGEITAKGAAYMQGNGIGWKDSRLVQKSGPKNALGLVKFDMRNEHAIYLHDTPAKALFAKLQRQLSHGCVRVENALEFADRIAADEGVQAEWAKARGRQDETFVDLPKEIPVRLIYKTAFMVDGGAVRYTTDPYGWDDAVGQALGFTSEARNKFRSDADDTGP